MAALTLSTTSSQNAYSPVAALSLSTASSQNVYCPVAALSLSTGSSQNAYSPVAALSLSTASSQNVYCPVAALSLSTARRGHKEGPLFCKPDLSPITHSQLNSWLSGSLSWASLHQLNRKAQSFRVGAATHASAQGYSDAQIQRTGRWKSSAFKKIYSYHLFRNTVNFHCHIFVSLALGGVQLSFFFLFGGGFQVICGLWCLPRSSAFGRGLGYNTGQFPCCKPSVWRN